MSDVLRSEIVDLCRQYGMGQCGLDSIRNFIAAAYHHAGLPGTLPADKHVAFNSAIRFATNRIACRGRHGDSIGMSRMVSRRALTLRDQIAADLLPRKLQRWRSDVTWEHQEPVVELTRFAEEPERSVDAVVLQMLRFPGVVVTKVEERAIEPQYRTAGEPAVRYQAPGIEPLLVEQGTFEFFRDLAGARVTERKGKYFEPFKPFEEA